MKISFPKPEVHPKGWGAETWLINCPDYCSKFLDFKKDSRGSMHFHDKKHETWYILSGQISVSWVDALNAQKHSRIISVGEMVDIPRLQTHQVHALEDTRILEVSTQHFEDDSYRVMAGDSQTQIK
jgi:mannose-6-phosphate isomerase-like protein (cupin superfamily)